MVRQRRAAFGHSRRLPETLDDSPSNSLDLSRGRLSALKAPWSSEVIQNPAQIQSGERYGHPYNCINRGDRKHRDNGNDRGCLVPTSQEWICPDCEYTQDWAHESSIKMPLSSEIAGLVTKLMAKDESSKGKP